MSNEEPDPKEGLSISSHGDVNITGPVIGRDQINNTFNALNIFQQVGENKLQLRDPFPQDGHTIIDATSILDFSFQDIERYLGEAMFVTKRGIGTSEELPDGGETRTYRHSLYTIDINYDKFGKAKGVLLSDGLLEQAFTLEHWSVVLSKLGMTVLGQPEVVAPAARLWKNYKGYGIQIYSAGNRSSNIQSIRVFKLPT